MHPLRRTDRRLRIERAATLVPMPAARVSLPDPARPGAYVRPSRSRCVRDARVRRARAMLLLIRSRLHHAWIRLPYSTMVVLVRRAEDCLELLRLERARLP